MKILAVYEDIRCTVATAIWAVRHFFAFSYVHTTFAINNKAMEDTNVFPLD